ncbi:unnamed protein product [Coregonus sp. 'balchen']|nr:unnamed protein product [Coregonus sp. 'balchen']
MVHPLVYLKYRPLRVLARFGLGDGAKGEKEGGNLIKRRASRTIQIILLSLLVNYITSINGAILR